MDWKLNDKGNWITAVARRDGYYVHRFARTQKVFTENGELTVLFADDNGAAHGMTFAAGAWESVEVYLSTPPAAPQENQP